MKIRKYSDFEILNKVGEGGEGDIFSVKDKLTGQMKILKII